MINLSSHVIIMLCGKLIQLCSTLCKVKITHLCPTLCDPMDYTVPGILQARILEWVAFPFSRGSSQPRDRTQVSCTARGFFTSWAIREVQHGSLSNGFVQLLSIIGSFFSPFCLILNTLKLGGDVKWWQRQRGKWECLKLKTRQRLDPSCQQ